MAPINLPDGSKVSEVVLPDGSTASKVIAPDGSTVFDGIPDTAGLHYYLADNDPGVIEYYTCPNPYDLGNKTLQYTLTGLDRHPGICLNDDGTRAIVYEGDDSGTYRQYDLTTAWDLSTVTNQTDVTSLTDSGRGSIQFGDGGSRFYITNAGSGSHIKQYDLSTDYDITTASLDGSADLGQGGQTGQPAFNSDGTVLYWGERFGTDSEDIYSSPLSTAFDITTTGSVDQFTTNRVDPSGLAITYNGSQLFIRHWSPNDIDEYDFGTAFDLSTLSFQQQLFASDDQSASHQFSKNPWQ